MRRGYQNLILTQMFFCFIVLLLGSAKAQGPDLVRMRGGIGGQGEYPRDVEYSPNGSVFASCDGQGVKIWRVSDGMMLRTINNNALFLEFSASGDRLAGVAPDGVYFWRVADGKLLGRIASGGGNLRCFALSADWQFVATGADDKAVRLFRVADGSPLAVFTGHTAAVDSVAFSPDGTQLVSGAGQNAQGTDLTCRTWNISSGTAGLVIRGPTMPSGGNLSYGVAFSSDQSQVILNILGDHLTRCLFDAATGSLLTRYNVISNTGFQTTAFAAQNNLLHAFRSSPDGSTGALGTAYGYILFNIADGSGSRQISALQTTPVALCYTPDGKQLLLGNNYGGNGDAILQFRMVADGSLARNITPPGPSGFLRAFAVSRDGQTIASCTNHGDLLFRRGSDGLPYLDAGPEVDSIAISPDSKLCACNPRPSGAGGDLLVSRMSDGSQVADIRLPYGDAFNNIQFSPDGQFLMAPTYKGPINVYKTSDWSLAAIHVSVGAFPRISPDGRYVATIHNGGISIYSWPSFDFVRSYDPPNGYGGEFDSHGLDWSPDSKAIVFGPRFSPGGLYYVSVPDMQLAWFTGQDVGSEDTVAVSPDGQVVALASAGRAKIIFLSASDGQVLSEYTSETYIPTSYWGGVQSLTYSTDGKFLYYGRGDGTLCCALNPYRNAVFPSIGGNTGNVTVKIVTALDFPVADGTTVTLRDGVHPDITANATVVHNPNATTDHVLSMTFDLLGAPLGMRDVVISVPGIGTRTYPQGFTIEQGRPVQLSADLVGRQSLRANAANYFYSYTTNLGNTDAADARTWFSTPAVLDVMLPDAPLASSIYQDVTARVFRFDLPSVPALATATIRIGIVPPNSPAVTHVRFSAFGAALPAIAEMVGLGADSGMRTTGGGTGATPPIQLPVGPCCPACQQSFNALIGYGSVYASLLQADLFAWAAYLAAAAQFVSALEVAVLSADLVKAALDYTVAAIVRWVGGLTPAEVISSNLLTAYLGVVASIMNDIITFVFNHGDPAAAQTKIRNDLLYDVGLFLVQVNTFGVLLVNAPGVVLAAWAAALGAVDRLKTDIDAAINVFTQNIQQLTDTWNQASAADVSAQAALDNLVTALLAYWQCCMACQSGSSPGNMGAVQGAGSSSAAGFGVVTSYDPNDLAGSLGYGAAQWISSQVPLNYVVSFGNEPTATAPAQTVVVTDHLDAANLDMTAVNLGMISVAGQQVTPTLEAAPPVGKRQFNADVDLRPNKNLIVHVNAVVDMLTGDLTWTFTSIDPATGLPPTDPLAGFLDPGQDGSVLFSVVPKSTVPTGTVVNDQATVVFDVNQPMNTPTWFNTLDNDPPVSTVIPLSATSTGSFTVYWRGGDIGSGLRDFTLYVSDNGGPFTPWLTNTTDTQATFTGTVGHTYAFYSQARDNAYNIEATHPQPDTRTKVISSVIDVSAQVSVTRGGFRLNHATGRYVQTVTLKNTGTTAITGPVSLVLDSLSSNAALFNQTGVTSTMPPAGSPYLDVTPGNLAAGASVPVVLEFTNPTNKGITYQTRVLAGPGSR